MAQNPREVLEDAKHAAQSGDYSDALNKFEYFFEHALDEDPYSLYGVRLSYCLDEWIDLGEKYPPALERLHQLKEISLTQLNETKDPERFHDYMAICRYLGCADKPVTQFLHIHSHEQPLAQAIVRFIWDDLVKAEMWDICAEYLPDPKEEYEHSIAKFDEALKICQSDSRLNEEEFKQQIKGWYVVDVSNILLVLQHTGQRQAFDLIHEYAGSDLQYRGCGELLDEINQKLSL